MSLLLRFFVWLGRLYTGFNLALNLESNEISTAVSQESGNKSCNNNISCRNRNMSKRNHKHFNGTQIRHSTNMSNGKTHKKSNAHFIIEPLFVPVHWPVFTILISLLQWASFEFGHVFANNGWISETDFEANHLKRHEIWRQFTSLLVHGGDMHLWNLLSEQMMFGCCLELVHGWKPVLALYFGGALIADLADLIGGTADLGCGASGAFAAICAGNLVNVILNWTEITCAITRAVILFICVFGVLTGAYWWPIYLAIFEQEFRDTYETVLDSNISHSSHIGGIISGFIFGFCLLKNFREIPW